MSRRSVLPGVTAMLAAAAAPARRSVMTSARSTSPTPAVAADRSGCVAADADFAIAMYNPRSASRPDGFGRVLEILREAAAASAS